MGDTSDVIVLRAERWPGDELPAPASAASPARDAPIVVAVQASDTLLGTGAMAYLLNRPGIMPVPPSRTAEADVVLVLAARLTDDIAAWMRQSAETYDRGTIQFVLVSDCIQVPQLMRAMYDARLSVLPWQGSDYERVVQAIFQLQARSELSAASPRPWPVGELVTAGCPATAHDPPTSLIRGRELDVLRLVADGLDTAEIAVKLNYSERTIKTSIHTLLTRLQLRNRPHAVAFAMRRGLL